MTKLTVKNSWKGHNFENSNSLTRNMLLSRMWSFACSFDEFHLVNNEKYSVQRSRKGHFFVLNHWMSKIIEWEHATYMHSLSWWSFFLWSFDEIQSEVTEIKTGHNCCVIHVRFTENMLLLCTTPLGSGACYRVSINFSQWLLRNSPDKVLVQTERRTNNHCQNYCFFYESAFLNNAV